MSTRPSLPLPLRVLSRPFVPSLVLAVAALASTGPAAAVGVFTAPCGDPVDIVGEVSAVVHCSIGTWKNAVS